MESAFGHFGYTGHWLSQASDTHHRSMDNQRTVADMI